MPPQTARQAPSRRSAEERNALLLSVAPLIKNMVACFRRNHPQIRQKVSFEELESHALFVALRCADVWDETRQIAFTTYVHQALGNKFWWFANEVMTGQKRSGRRHKLPFNSKDSPPHRKSVLCLAMRPTKENRHLWAPGGAPDAEPERADEASFLRECMKHLTPRQRAVCEARLEGLTWPQIAARLDCSVANTHEISRRAFAHLREMLTRPTSAHAH